MLLSEVFKRYEKDKLNSIVVIIDQALTKKEQGYLKQIIKSQIKLLKLKFNIYFFATKSDHNSQIADYGAWSQYVNLERGEDRPFNEIKDLVKSSTSVSLN